MLELRPNCEWCDRSLPPDSLDARVCSYECTYCADCVETVLNNVCATCGGELVRRPIRPARAHRDQPRLGLENQPAATDRKRSRWTPEQVDDIRRRLEATPPTER